MDLNDKLRSGVYMDSIPMFIDYTFFGWKTYMITLLKSIDLDMGIFIENDYDENDFSKESLNKQTLSFIQKSLNQFFCVA